MTNIIGFLFYSNSILNVGIKKALFVYNFVPHLFQNSEQHKKGEKYFVRALKITEAYYGKNHVKVADSYQKLGRYYIFKSPPFDGCKVRFNDHENKILIEKAENCFKKVLGIQKNIVSDSERRGLERVDLLIDQLGTAYDDMDRIYTKTGRLEEGQQFLSEGVACRKKAGALRLSKWKEEGKRRNGLMIED